MLSESRVETGTRLSRLSAKEREVLDQILLHKSLKVIAHDLGITLSAVDQRLKSARFKLDASDRNEAARAYSGLLATCRDSTCGFEAIGAGLDAHVFQSSEPPSGSMFMLQDSAAIVVPPPWFEQGHRGAVSEVLDEKFGRLWRVAAIPVFAITIAIFALALMAMAQSLGELL
ncbi:MAG: sigma factor-like helix-turn-helix DNA-binding protein [Novosphingobium sp.]